MTKDVRENQQLPKMEGIPRDGNDDGREDGSEELSIKTESFTHNNPQFSINHTRSSEPLNRPLVIFCHYYSVFILSYSRLSLH
jgi:hypothetical protein